MAAQQETYVPKSILITGGAGFIASHVVLRLLREYSQYKVCNIFCLVVLITLHATITSSPSYFISCSPQVVVLDKLDYCASMNNLFTVKENPNFKVCSISSCCTSFPLIRFRKLASVLLQFVKGDIQSMDLLTYVLATEKIDTVMHFAAQVRLWLTIVLTQRTER